MKRVEQVGRIGVVIGVIGIWAVLGAVVGFNAVRETNAAIIGGIVFAAVAGWTAVKA